MYVLPLNFSPVACINQVACGPHSRSSCFVAVTLPSDGGCIDGVARRDEGVDSVSSTYLACASWCE